VLRLLNRGRSSSQPCDRTGELALASRRARRRAKADAARLKQAAARLRRRVPSPRVVHDLLPLRLPTLASRARDAAAEQHESELCAVSDAYREAVANLDGPSPGLLRTDVQGLTWWVPQLPSMGPGSIERVLSKQRFPYRAITQTRELSVGPAMIDVGANLGRMSIPRVILGDFSRAYCAEPDPLNFECLVRNVADNGLRGLVLPDRVAIADRTGGASLIRAKYPGGHRIAARSAHNAIAVPAITLDAWCDRLSIDPDLVTYVKVDTQGFEHRVLLGASRLLARRHIAWQLEISPALLDAAGTPAAALFAFCADRFTHFIDLGKQAEGPRARRTRDLAAALDYVADQQQTDILLFNAR
jgi:FkbM family methyltransferase